MRRAIVKAVSAVSLVAFVSTNVFFAYPEKASAQAGAASSCVAGYGAAAIAALTGAPQNVVGVPKSQIGDTAQNVITSGSANALSFNNCILKPLAQTMVITLIRNIGSSIVDWVNSGFEGKPLFITDFEGMLLDAADQTLGQFIEGSELGWLCNDFSFQIRIALATKYSKPFREQVRCTLSDIGDNINEFVDNNGGKGWDNWLKLTTQPNNNAYGAFLIADSEAIQRALSATGVKKERAAMAEGFLDYDKCTETAPMDDPRPAVMNNNTALGTVRSSFASSTNGGFVSSKAFSTPEGTKCVAKTVTTPGKIISGKLSSVLGQSEIQNAVADEIDEIIAATLNQLAQKMIQGAAGLLGLSSKSSTRPPSYLDAYRAQIYGDTAAASTGVGIGASSELDSYRLGSYEETQALLNNTRDPNIGAINDLVNSTVNSASNQQREQLESISNSAGIVASAETNSALLKSTSQSSGSNPNGAADGITLTSQYMRGSATAGNESDPWWSVDIGSPKKIKEVRVWKVTDKPASETLEVFRVVVSGGAEGTWTSAAIDGTSVANPIVVPVGREGDVVRIEKIATSYQCDYYRYSFGETCYYPLELAEVEVITEVTGIETSSTGSSPSGGSSSGSTSQTGQGQSSGSSSSSGGGTASTILTQANSQLLRVAPSSDSLKPSLAGIKDEYSFSLSGGPYTIPTLNIALTKNGQDLSAESVFSGAEISLVQGDRRVNFQPGTASGITLQNVGVSRDGATKITLSGTPLAAARGTYTIVLTAKDSAGLFLGTANLEFVVQ